MYLLPGERNSMKEYILFPVLSGVEMKTASLTEAGLEACDSVTQATRSCVHPLLPTTSFVLVNSRLKSVPQVVS